MSQSQSRPLSQAQQAVIDFLDYRPPGWRPGDIDELERWWVDRQVALERAGYMLRSRYRPGWNPSWAGTKTFYLDCEDGQSVGVSVTFLPPPTRAHGCQLRLGMDATRISDGKPVMLKRLLAKEGPYEHDINKLFSTEPLASNPKNHCVQLLDVIELPGDPPILVHPLLRPFYDPPLQTYGEFVTFFAQICEVSPMCSH